GVCVELVQAVELRDVEVSPSAASPSEPGRFVCDQPPNCQKAKETLANLRPGSSGQGARPSATAPPRVQAPCSDPGAIRLSRKKNRTPRAGTCVLRHPIDCDGSANSGDAAYCDGPPREAGVLAAPRGLGGRGRWDLRGADRSLAAATGGSR